MQLEERDRREIEAHGLTVEEVLRQIRLFESPPPFTRLERACTVGDGIRVLEEEKARACEERFEEARASGRARKFVPASGAATRMFRALVRFRNEAGPVGRGAVARKAEAGDGEAREFLRFLENLDRFPFYPDLCRVLRREVRPPDLEDDATVRRVLAAILDPEGLGYAGSPKGLLPFHRYGDEVRTAFEEHLVESVLYVRDAGGTSRLHFTVSPEHLSRFEALRDRVREAYERRYATRFEVEFSVQKPSTDTIAVDLENRPFRTRDGRLLFRPGGHGALLENLDELGGDLVFLKNIDNVVPDRLQGTVALWKRRLGGYLVELEERRHHHLRRLRTGEVGERELEEAERFAREELLVSGLAPGLSPDERCRRLLRKLDRPLRVCGMVKNTGEPGGGPFWVRGPDGDLSLQIVESAQVDMGSPEQRAIFLSSTHFNPVDMVCALRDERGRPYDLRRFVDESAVFVAEKSHEGRPLKALERPGLWNGSMAGWISVFVEVPLETFAPVKTVNDLLRPEHRA
ncbi:MAG: hypothetical protein KatS3mg076_3284 [Candidatus Binatia bacterium]|nr:MAG: hypothetical protein KatS3mg076_3284 [Candidatus Binatia bacterium]